MDNEAINEETFNEDKAPESKTSTAKKASVKKEAIVYLPIKSLVKFKGNIFKPYDEAKLNQMAKSIEEQGVIHAIVVRRMPDEPNKYEIISGHNRVEASRIAKKDTIKAIIEDLDDDTAILKMINSNTSQREKIYKSELAKIYKNELEILNRQGQRSANDTSDQDGQMLSRDVVAKRHNTSPTQVQRYVRLNNLIPELLDGLDNGSLSLVAAEHLSYLKEEEQSLLNKVVIEMKVKKISIAQSEAIKKYSTEVVNVENSNDMFDRQSIESILFNNVSSEVQKQKLLNDFSKMIRSGYERYSQLGKSDIEMIMKEAIDSFVEYDRDEVKEEVELNIS